MFNLSYNRAHIRIRREIFMRITKLLFYSLVLFAGYHTIAYAETPSEFILMIKNHQFSPNTFTVPANKKIKLIVNNQDDTAEEFESYSLNREKVIPAKTQAKIFIGPLKPGKYDFFGEFHKDTATGKITAQ